MTLSTDSGLLHITRLQVKQLRRFDDFTLEHLDPGLNIIAGPNGAGKSTLVRALRAAFLDRYGSSSAGDLQPHGNSSAAPSVELDFSLHGLPHRLSKTFLKKKRCDLQAGGRVLSEQAAEDYLAEALGFGFAQKGSKADHWGVPGLLWVEQGLAPDVLAARVGFASSHLGAALHAQSPEISMAPLTATAGDALIKRLEGELATLLGKSRKPIGAYASLLDEIAQREQQRLALEERIASYRTQVDTLSQLLAEQQRDAQNPPDAQWKVQLEQARVQWQAWNDLQQRHDQSQQRAQQLRSELEALTGQLQAFAQRKEEWQRREKSVHQAETVYVQALQLQAEAGTILESAQCTHKAAQQRKQWAQFQQQRRQLEAQHQTHQRALEKLLAAQTQASAHFEKLQRLTQERSTYSLEKADFDQVLELQKKVDQARMQRDATATQLRFALPDAQSLPWEQGEQRGLWQGEGLQWLEGKTTLQLPGGGTLQIIPGGSDGVTASQRCVQAETALAAALQRWQLESVAAATTQWERRSSLESELSLVRQLLAVQAPDGLEALALTCSQQAQQLEAVQQQLQALPKLPADGVTTKPSEMAMEWPEIEAAAQVAEQALQSAQKAMGSAEQKLALSSQQLKTAQQECAAIAHALTDPSQIQRHNQVEQQVAMQQAAWNTLERTLEQDRQALESAQGRFAEQDIQRWERSLQSYALQAQQRQQRIAELRAALDATGAQGLEETHAALVAEQAYAQRRAQEMQSRAQALMAVVDRLHAKRTAALHRLQSPLEQRLRHYVQLLLPGAHITLDANLVPHAIAAPQGRNDGAAARITGELIDLSYGTQEQLGVLSRLAYADLLREAGRPTLLMLDDALVYSDATRRDQMKRALFDAAKRHQMLLFTCHPELWCDMGVAVRHVETM